MNYRLFYYYPQVSPLQARGFSAFVTCVGVLEGMYLQGILAVLVEGLSETR